MKGRKEERRLGFRRRNWEVDVMWILGGSLLRRYLSLSFLLLVFLSFEKERFSKNFRFETNYSYSL